MHSAFLRQLSFEIIPFIVLFGIRDVQFITITNTQDFFNSVIGRSMMGMVGFTFVSYLITSASPHKINTSIEKKDKDEKYEKEDEKEDEKDDEKQDEKQDDNNIPENKDNPTLIFEKFEGTTKNNKIKNYYLLD
jgi:uncharacterized membrane protein YcgQ (UPF0703/DUF1980 family)